MRSESLKRARTGLLALCTVLAVGCAAAAERDMPALTVVDAANAEASLPDLAAGVQWVVLVLDADMAISREVLANLDKVALDWNGRLVIVSQGSADGAQALRDAVAPLTGVRWYRADGVAATQALELAGAPALVAIDTSGKIVLSAIGFGDAPDRHIATMKTWIGAIPR